MDEELWVRVHNAVLGARRAVQEHWDDPAAYRPRVSMPRVSTSSSGWPSLYRSPGLYGSDGPLQASALFAPQVDTLHPLTHRSVPELAELIEYIRNREDLRDLFSLPVKSEADPDIRQWRQRYFEQECVDLALHLLDRTAAVGSDDSDLLELYCEREKAVLAETLEAEMLVPLALTSLELDEPLELAPQLRLEPIDAATQAVRAPQAYSVHSVPPPVINAATHMIVVGGVNLPNRPRAVRQLGNLQVHLPLERVDRVCEALRIATDQPTGYAQVLLRPLGWADGWEHDLPPVSQEAVLRRYPERFDDFAWNRAPLPIPRAHLELIPNILSSLENAPKSVKLATRRLSLAELRSQDEDRVIDACIGLEALLGNSRDELSHRLSLRAAACVSRLGATELSSAQVYDLSKRIYSHRSSIVHGTSETRYAFSEVGGRRYNTAMLAVDLLRVLLFDRLSSKAPWTPESLDRQILEALDAPRAAEPAEASPAGGKSA